MLLGDCPQTTTHHSHLGRGRMSFFKGKCNYLENRYLSDCSSKRCPLTFIRISAFSLDMWFLHKVERGLSTQPSPGNKKTLVFTSIVCVSGVFKLSNWNFMSLFDWSAHTMIRFKEVPWSMVIPDALIVTRQTVSHFHTLIIKCLKQCITCITVLMYHLMYLRHDICQFFYTSIYHNI